MTSPHSPEPAPTQFEPADPRHVRVKWTTGEEFTVPFTELRFYCPCASCVDEHTGRRMIKREDVNDDIRVTGAEAVGRYALQIRFSDLHATGIFSFGLLYTLCKKTSPS